MSTLMMIDSNHSHQRLAPLHRVTLLPESYAPTMEVVTKLKQIKRSQVSESMDSNHKRFIVDVAIRPQSQNHIPVLKNHDDNDDIEQQSSSVAHYQIEHTLDDFIAIRAKLHGQAHFRHRTAEGNIERCAFCVKVLNFVLSGEAQPTPALRWFLPHSKLLKTLTIFVTSMLELALACKPNMCPNCPGQSTIPMLVCEFLFGQPEPPL